MGLLLKIKAYSGLAAKHYAAYKIAESTNDKAGIIENIRLCRAYGNAANRIIKLFQTLNAKP